MSIANSDALGPPASLILAFGKVMTRQEKSELQELKTAVIKDMVSYMKFGGAENETDPDFDAGTRRST